MFQNQILKVFELACLRYPFLTSQGDKDAASGLFSRVVQSHSGKCRQPLTEVKVQN